MVHLVFLHFRENVISTKCCVFANKGNNAASTNNEINSEKNHET